MRIRDKHQKHDLAELAVRVMRQNGLHTGFSDAALQQLESLDASVPVRGDAALQDLSHLLWCSIDNDDSLDLDQLTTSEVLPGGEVRVLVAVADVDALVHKDTPIDQHARSNTTSVYTSAIIFPMLPERLSNDLTSLNPNALRAALVTDMVFRADGSLAHSEVYRALVQNKAKLAYDAVSAWLEARAPLPEAAAAVPGMDQQLRTQDSVAQQLRARRRAQGALEFQTFQPRAVFEGEKVVAIVQQEHNRARQLIEEFMIATNGVAARFLGGRRRASLRRVVRSPERWLRIMAVAEEYGDTLPPEPSSVALEAFLAKRRAKDPDRFPDLSLTIIKLMGSGEYVVEMPRDGATGHFGLAVRHYAHSTAPNRRFPDLITMRLIKAVLAKKEAPYSLKELTVLAAHCTRQEDAVRKVERQMRKSEAALLLGSRLGEAFDGIVTGVSKGNTWVRIFHPPAEGKLLVTREVKVGRRVRARLLSTDVEHGFIDFEMLEAA